MGKVLIIDDDVTLTLAFTLVIEKAGHNVLVAHTLKDGVELALSEPLDVVFLDVRMPDGSGLDELQRIREAESRPEVIVLTADGEPEGAEYAIRQGAWDYIEKPPSCKALLAPLSRALEHRRERSSGRQAPLDIKRTKIIGKSPKIQLCLDLLAQAAACDANVLLTGETGTGKELFARAIHDNNSRSSRNFVVLDCTALPETLVESVLFGHCKGAFTGADSDQEGLISQAHGGTLFLDEIGELSLNLQKKFLRVLQERSFRPVGCKEERSSNFRLVAATNRDLDEMIEEGSFRKDLLFRLRSVHIELPSIRERPEDIPDLVQAHVSRLCELYNMKRKSLSAEFLEALSVYDWPGNVRELVNTLDGAIMLAGANSTLFCEHLPTHIRIRILRKAFGRKNCAGYGGFTEEAAYPASIPKLKEFRDALEKQYLERLISHTKRDVPSACSISGLSKTRLYELLHKHKLFRRAFSSDID